MVALCSPLMQRAHSLPQAGELVFVDATSNVDADNYHLYMMFTHSMAGGVPLGVFITHSEENEAIYEAINLLKTILPEK